MDGTQEIIQEASALPVEERIRIVDYLLKSLNAPTPEVEAAWLIVANRRLGELRAGQIQAIPGEQVFTKAMKRHQRQRASG